MSPVIPFRRRSKHRYAQLALAALTAAAFGLAATWAFVTWHSGGVDLSRGVGSPPIEVIDGDTVRFNGAVYRLVGFDTPERGDKARCDDDAQHSRRLISFDLRAFSVALLETRIQATRCCAFARVGPLTTSILKISGEQPTSLGTYPVHLNHVSSTYHLFV
jgi:hypothetical protein